MVRRPLDVLTTGLLILTIIVPASAQDEGSSRRRVGVNGGISAAVTHYTANTDVLVRDPITWILNGNATVYFNRWSMPFSVTISRQRSDLNVPTFARIGVSPTWSWGKAHLGYRTMRFSQFTVGGTTFLGAGLELNPGLLRFGVLAGQFQNAREDQPEESIRARYRRRGLGFKLGVGTERNHFDVIFFKAKDDSTSLEAAPIDPRTTPMDNAVVGVDVSVSPVQAVTVYAEVAASALNRDVRSDEIDTDLPSIFSSIFEPRESAQANLAARAGINLNQTYWGVKAEYLWVEPDYQTLGSYYFNTDVQSVTLSPRFSVLQGRINVSLSGGWSRNNLYDDLTQTTERLIGSANLNWRISRLFRISALYSNYSSDQSAGLIEENDSTRVTNVSRNIMVSPQFQWGRDTRHNLSVRVSQQTYDQTSMLTGFDLNTSTRNIGVNYSVFFSNSDLRLRFSATSLGSETATSDITTRSLSGGLTKGLVDGMLSLDFRVALRQRDRGTGSTATNLTTNLGLTVTPTRYDSFSLRSNYSNRSSVSADDDSISDFITTVTYARRFAI